MAVNGLQVPTNQPSANIPQVARFQYTWHVVSVVNKEQLETGGVVLSWTDRVDRCVFAH